MGACIAYANGKIKKWCSHSLCKCQNKKNGACIAYANGKM